MILEQQIDKAVEQISGEALDKELIIFSKESPLSEYISGETFRFLNQDERELLLFIQVVIWKITVENNIEFDEDLFLHYEEQNWEFSANKFLKWPDLANIFFEDYPEEDLLAFVEDMLQEDSISDTAKLTILTVSKSTIDAYFLEQDT